MKILLTGFEPFGGEKINPAYEILKTLPESMDGYKLVKREIPTSFKESTKLIESLLEAEAPDVVLSLGQAGGSLGLVVEKVGLNLRDAESADNDGHRASHEIIYKDGETAYFSTLPVKAIVKKIRDSNVPASLSYTAGAYVCNNVLYTLLYLAKKRYKNMRCGFIHVPYFPEQIIGKRSTHYMTPEEMTRGLMAALLAITENSVDIDFIKG